MSLLRSLLWSSVALLSLAGCGTDDDPSELGSSAESLLAVGPPSTYQVSPVTKRSSSWSFNDTGVDLGTAWRTNTAATTGWSRGTGPLGYGESYLATPVSYGADASNKHPTTYFRAPFLKNSGHIAKMYLRVMYDDGFVFYLNGHEGGRASMPSGPVTYATLAASHEAEDTYVTFDITSQIPNISETGPNTLAVEVHQDSRSSSDLVFDAELVMWMDGTSDYPSQQRILRGEMWTVWDQAGAPTSTWKTSNHDDTGWKSAPAPLGYGESYLAAETNPGLMTTYFHHDFTVSTPAQAVFADVMYDDGFVAYMNGAEIARPSMPSGAIGQGTAAFDHEANGYQHFDWTAAAAPLIHPGLNTLAVEVHQTATTSSDLVFDLALEIANGWRAQASGTTALLEDVTFTSADHGYAVGAAGTLTATTDGVHWATRPTGVAVDLHGVGFCDADRGVIVGDAGTALVTTDGGATWTPSAIATTAGLLDLSIDGDQAWTVDGSDVLYRSDDCGLTWIAVPTATGGSFRAVSFFGGDRGWIAGDIPVPGDSHSAIYGTADGGATWTQQWVSDLHGHYLFDLDRTEEDRAWAVGELSLSGHGEFKLQTTDGATWTPESYSSNDAGIFGIDFVDGSRGWGVGFGGSIVHSTDGGASWSVQQTSLSGQQPSLYAVHFFDGQRGWAVGEHGAILATTTGGV